MGAARVVHSFKSARGWEQTPMTKKRRCSIYFPVDLILSGVMFILFGARGAETIISPMVLGAGGAETLKTAMVLRAGGAETLINLMVLGARGAETLVNPMVLSAASSQPNDATIYGPY